MKRVIKFRAWHPKYREMVYSNGGTLWNKREFMPVIMDVGFSGYPQEEGWALMQFTGLLDKNGKEIYEGDLPGDTYESGVVEWCDKCHGWSIGIAEIPGHCHQCDGDFMWLDFVDDVRSGRVEIIGNIHENPELLK